MTEAENYKGINIEINHDFDAENPFESWDNNLPLMYKGGRDSSNDYSKGDINEYLSDILTDGQIIRHQNKIADAFEIDLEYFIERELSKDDKISEIRYEILQSENFNSLELICKLSKTPCLNTESRGYSQGDYAEIFICYTAKFEETTGCKISQIDEKFLQSNADLFSAWAWGDVYGYSIPKLEDEGRHASCNGFYGEDHEKSGLLNDAREQIDYHLKSIKENRFAKIKELIKAKVSFIYRPQILGKLLTTI